jgi:hypothetical protein
LLLFLCPKIALFLNFTRPLFCNADVGNIHNIYFNTAVVSEISVAFCDDFEMLGAGRLVSLENRTNLFIGCNGSNTVICVRVVDGRMIEIAGFNEKVNAKFSVLGL